MELLIGDEKCYLSLYVYVASYDKSGYIYYIMYTFRISLNKKIQQKVTYPYMATYMDTQKDDNEIFENALN